MKQLAIIANPSAGKGKALQELRAAQRHLWGRPIRVFTPNTHQELQAVCCALDSDEIEAAIVIGGDGTIHQAIRGLTQSGVPLYPFPGGTANDLAGEMGLKKDWHQVQNLLDGHQKSAVDLIEVNGTPFVTVAGMGVGSIPTQIFNDKRQSSWIFRQVSQKFGTEIYSALSAYTIFAQRQYAQSLHIKCDVFDEQLKTAAVFVCNQTHLGGNLKVAPRTQNDDKKFNVLVISMRNPVALLYALTQLKKGNQPDNFILFSTDTLTIKNRSGKPLSVFADGETIQQNHELRFKIMPRAIQIYRGKK